MSTILKLIDASVATSFVDVDLYLSKRLSTFRLDGTTDEIIITREDRSDYGSRYNRSEPYFAAFVNEFSWVKAEAFHVKRSPGRTALPPTLRDMFGAFPSSDPSWRPRPRRNRSPRRMSADLVTKLTAEYVQTATPSALLVDIRAWIQKARPSSLIHPRGFLILLLHRAGGEEWRFHVWPNGVRLISGMPARIHTHSKVVDGRVLKGKLTNIVYSVAEAPSGGSPVYEVEYPSDKYDPQATNLLKRSAMRGSPARD